MQVRVLALEEAGDLLHKVSQLCTDCGIITIADFGLVNYFHSLVKHECCSMFFTNRLPATEN